ncbi:MAG: glycosyltransferase family 4 protein [Candidatus Acidiferrum sp.]
MRITHVSTYDISGGAARAAYRLHAGLRRLGYDSQMLVAHKASEDSNVTVFRPARGLFNRIRRRVLSGYLAQSWRGLPSRPTGATFFTDDRSTFGAEMVEQLPPCDILQLHWIATFVDYGKLFRRVPRELPIVWTLHDMNPFTGGCHYAGNCERFRGRCGACPELLSADAEDFSAEAWRRKERALGCRGGRGIQVVTPSRWLAEQARGSTLFGKMPIEVIPYGVDTETFRQRDRKAARERFGVAAEAKVALFVAEWADEKRKGLTLLVEAFRRMKYLPGFCLAAIGRELPKELADVRSVTIGRVCDELTMSMAYSLADIFVIPSIQDNLPNTALEALACGTPVVGSDAGGIPEIVRDGATGLLFPAGDARSLAAAIEALLGDDERRAAMGAECRRVAVEGYALEIQAKRYANLYEEMLRGN